jgi:GTPase
VVISALTGRGLPRLLKAIDKVFEQYDFRGATADVNRVLDAATRVHTPPSVGGRRLKFFFATQAETRPPTFVIFSNFPEKVHFSYARFLSNRFKEAFGLDEIPVKLVFRQRGTRRKKK